MYKEFVKKKRSKHKAYYLPLCRFVIMFMVDRTDMLTVRLATLQLYLLQL